MRVEIKINGKWVDVSAHVRIGKPRPLATGGVVKQNFTIVGESGAETMRKVADAVEQHVRRGKRLGDDGSAGVSVAV